MHKARRALLLGIAVGIRLPAAVSRPRLQLRTRTRGKISLLGHLLSAISRTSVPHPRQARVVVERVALALVLALEAMAGHRSAALENRLCYAAETPTFNKPICKYRALAAV